jgi:hypothetical protein
MTLAAEDLIELMPYLNETEKRELDELLTVGVDAWLPQMGPQFEALESPADIVFYGGQAGGGKSDLLLGSALTRHKRSAIFRREGTQLIGLEERLEEIIGTRDGYNGTDHILRWNGRVLEFGAVKEPKDWKKYQGRPHDLKGFDEICHFTEQQFRSLIGWLRSKDPAQRCRVIATGNPPTETEGEWVIRYWAPWLDPTHPNPAKSGELRWFIVDGKGQDIEVSGPEPVMVKGRLVKPKSRTFIRSTLEDNLFYAGGDYRATLDGLPEPLRSQMAEGNFSAGRNDPVWQLIPTEWIKAAQARWTDKDNKGPMTALGFDPARGGLDKSSAARRHGSWFDRIVTIPGVVTNDGPKAAAFVTPLVRNGAPIPMDAIGIGTSAYDFLRGLNLRVVPVVASEGSTGRDSTGTLRFKNKRAEMYWRLREALDPTAEEPISLPPDQELLSDLAAVRFKVVQMGEKLAGIQIRDKDEIREVLGRSPDKGDSVAMTFIDGLPAAGITDDAARFRKQRGLE